MKKEIKLSLMGLLLVSASFAQAQNQSQPLQSSAAEQAIAIAQEEALKEQFFAEHFLVNEDDAKEAANERFYKENFLVSEGTQEEQKEKNFQDLFLK